MARKRSLGVLKPDLQISFYFRLQIIRDRYLHDGLRETVERVAIPDLDAELARNVAPGALAKLASMGVRGEVFFAVPLILRANPFLLGYYRLLLGFSQKELYNKGPFGRFKRLEGEGIIPPGVEPELVDLSRSLIGSASLLVDAVDTASPAIVWDLQLLTLGAQFRGSELNKIGQKATKEVFQLILELVGAYLKDNTARTIILENDSRRTVLIEFFSDPDVRVTEKLDQGVRPILSMEIKGGGDASNVHNRIGEAEKSHQKAKNLGFAEFWTLLRVPVDEATAGRGSPTTTRFFQLEQVVDRSTNQSRAFRELLSSHLGIRAG
jgi:hypothetical protein